MRNSNSLKNLFNVETLTAVITWAVVSCSSLYFMVKSGNHSNEKLIISTALYVGFLILWMLGTRDKAYSNDKMTRGLLVLAQMATIVGLYFMTPFTFTAIFTVILCSTLPFIVSFKTSLAISPFFSMPLWLVYGFYWNYNNMALTAVLFWTFNLFAIVMINSVVKAKEASEALSEKNRELLAAQSLLEQAAQQSERVRIARNIHDLLGHHLTALTIKLQVAERLSEGDAKHHISECHGLAKLLLSDVREAVTEIRAKASIDICSSITAIADATPRLTFNIVVDPTLNLQNVHVAELIMRTVQESITNTLKHGDATTMTIKLKEKNEGLELTILDNNAGIARQIIPGNGLKGIRERVEALSGEVNFDYSIEGFRTELQIKAFA